MADKNQNDRIPSFKEQTMRSLDKKSKNNKAVLSDNKIETNNQKVREEQSSEYLTEEQAKDYSDQKKTTSYNESEKINDFDHTYMQEKQLSIKNDHNENAGISKRKLRRREDGLVNKIVLIIISVLVLLISIFGITFYYYINAGLKPLDKTNTKLVQVYIPEGSSSKKIANILEESKIIKSGMVFNYYVKFKNMANFQAGYYQMAPSMQLDQISALLKEGGTAEPNQVGAGKVTIPEGYDINKIGDTLEKKTKFKKEDFLALMKNDKFFKQMHHKYPELLQSASEANNVRYKLEGYLFPATYAYYKKVTLEDFVEQMVKKTDDVMKTLKPAIQAKKMTNQQVLTLASLVEREGGKGEDRKKIAQVFYNRLTADIPLQSDISILYALNKQKEKISYDDLEVDSPYNLYKNVGYGPGPLDNPSEQSINAVLNPIKNDYMYFVADILTGKVYYSETYEEHQALVEKYVNKADKQ